MKTVGRHRSSPTRRQASTAGVSKRAMSSGTLFCTLLTRVDTACSPISPRLQAGRPARPLLFTGIRGVGKAAILTIARRAAADIRLQLVRLEACRRGALLEDIAFQLDAILTTLSSRRDATRRALEDLAEFKLGVQVARSGVEIAGRRREPIAGSLESRFQRLLASVATAAADAGAPLVVVIDELQQGPGDLLGPLLSALHLANQDEIQLDESTIEVHVVEVHEGGTKVCNVTCDPASRRTNRKRAGDQLSGQPHPLSGNSRTRTTVRTPRSSGTCDGHS